MKPRIRHTLLLIVAAILACVAVWRNWHSHRQERLDRLGWELHEAVERKDVEAIEDLLERGAPFTSTIRNSCTPLEAAIWFTDEPDTNVVLALARAAGLDSTAYSYEMRTAVMVAAQREATNVVHALLNNGADIDAARMGGVTALADAAASAQTNMVQLLLTKGADVNKSERAASSPLMYAAVNEDTELVRLLLEHGADPSYADYAGRTTLMYVQWAGLTNIAALLIEYGATTNGP